jgi:RNA polymerase-binding transcription factor DksA
MTIATSMPARPSSPRDVGDYLAKVETERRRQLDALPENRLDTVERAYRATLERIVDEVGTARERHYAGLYGICSGCDEAIDPDRLEFRPWATMCTECSKKLA